MYYSACCGQPLMEEYNKPICSSCLEDCDYYEELEQEALEEEADARNVSIETVINDWKNGSKYESIQ